MEVLRTLPPNRLVLTTLPVCSRLLSVIVRVLFLYT